MDKRKMLTGLLYLGAAIFAFALGRYLHREILDKRAWPTVTGRLVERGVGTKMNTGRALYLPHVKYTYVVAGTEYVGDQYYLIRNSGGLDYQVRKLVESLPEQVTVHYNPADPQQTFLIVNPLTTYWILIGMAALALLIGLLQLLTAAVNP